MYKALLELLTEHRADFYELLLHYHKAILKECSARSKQEVAGELGFKSSNFTYIYRMLEAYNRIQLKGD